eukprot:7381321-Prymnesium_polylepis.1
MVNARTRDSLDATRDTAAHTAADRSPAEIARPRPRPAYRDAQRVPDPAGVMSYGYESRAGLLTFVWKTNPAPPTHTAPAPRHRSAHAPMGCACPSCCGARAPRRLA